jgi:hypothetical protein
MQNATRPETCGNFVYGCRAAGAELMSAAASPGRTWIISSQCGMPDLASAPPASLLCSGDRGICISDLARSHSSAQEKKYPGKGDRYTESAAELRGCGWLDRIADPVPVDRRDETGSTGSALIRFSDHDYR